MPRILKVACLVLLSIVVLLLWACAPAAAPTPTATKPPAAPSPTAAPKVEATKPAAAATPAPTKPPAATPTAPGKPVALSPAGEKAAASVPAPYKGMKSPFAPDNQAAVTAGQAIYTQRCLACHGEKGDGKGPAGAALTPPPANFSTAAQLEHFEKIQDHHFWTVSEGVPGTAMPPFNGQLTEEQRWQVLMYEWKLGRGG